jgi:hypothetical protein
MGTGKTRLVAREKELAKAQGCTGGAGWGLITEGTHTDNEENILLHSLQKRRRRVRGNGCKQKGKAERKKRNSRGNREGSNCGAACRNQKKNNKRRNINQD